MNHHQRLTPEMLKGRYDDTFLWVVHSTASLLDSHGLEWVVANRSHLAMQLWQGHNLGLVPTNEEFSSRSPDAAARVLELIDNPSDELVRALEAQAEFIGDPDYEQDRLPPLGVRPMRPRRE